MKRTSVGILVFPDVEVLDFAGPFEVFSVTRLNEETRYSDSSPFDVFPVADTKARGRWRRASSTKTVMRSSASSTTRYARLLQQDVQ